MGGAKEEWQELAQYLPFTVPHIMSLSYIKPVVIVAMGVVNSITKQL